MPESLFSHLSEAESPITEPTRMSTDALVQEILSKRESTEDLPASFFDQKWDNACEPKHPYHTATTPRS